jgi:hypothetical protein
VCDGEFGGEDFALLRVLKGGGGKSLGRNM